MGPELRWSDEEAARIVRETYGAVVPDSAATVAEALYDASELAGLPGPAIAMALGLGNPVRVADIRSGETVLDLGSGGGIDTLLAARRAGSQGRAYGLDMTPAMIEKARRHAALVNASNVEFVEGRMEAIPLPESSVDVAISNGVINLVTSKGKMFREILRVLRPGGRLVFADSVIDGCLPVEVLESEAAYAGWLAGALAEQALIEVGQKAGFIDIEIVGDRAPLSKDRLKRYPLFSVEFLDWLFTKISEDRTPIYTAHFRMVKPASPQASPGSSDPAVD